MLQGVSLTVHEATWHMWRRCRDLLAWIDHSDVLLVPEECTRTKRRCAHLHSDVLLVPEPYWRYMHEAKMCTHATHALIPSHAHAGTRADGILYQDPPHVII